jgi:hypothetical protein
MRQLDVWSTQLTEEQKNQVLRDNFSTLNKFGQFTNMSLLLSYSTSAANSTASGSFVSIPNFLGQFQSSGGLVIVFGVVGCFNGTAVAGVTTQLLVDGGIKSVSSSYSNSANLVCPEPHFWAGNLNAGSHSIDFQFKVVTGGTAITNQNGEQSYYYVIEFAKG